MQWEHMECGGPRPKVKAMTDTLLMKNTNSPDGLEDKRH
jgi:hypothetical protein